MPRRRGAPSGGSRTQCPRPGPPLPAAAAAAGRPSRSGFTLGLSLRERSLSRSSPGGRGERGRRGDDRPRSPAPRSRGLTGDRGRLCVPARHPPRPLGGAARTREPRGAPGPAGARRAGRGQRGGRSRAPPRRARSPAGPPPRRRAPRPPARAARCAGLRSEPAAAAAMIPPEPAPQPPQPPLPALPSHVVTTIEHLPAEAGLSASARAGVRQRLRKVLNR